MPQEMLARVGFTPCSSGSVGNSLSFRTLRRPSSAPISFSEQTKTRHSSCFHLNYSSLLPSAREQEEPVAGLREPGAARPAARPAACPWLPLIQLCLAHNPVTSPNSAPWKRLYISGLVSFISQSWRRSPSDFHSNKTSSFAFLSTHTPGNKGIYPFRSYVPPQQGKN